MTKLMKGLSAKPSESYRTKLTSPETQVYQSNHCGPFVILGEAVAPKKGNDKNVLVRFLNTGFVRESTIGNCKAGKVRDPYARVVLGLGYLGEPDKGTPYYTRAHHLWHGILTRCYSTTLQARSYYQKGTQVSVRWLNFALFLEDLPKLEGFDLWLTGEKVEIDKDKKVGGGGRYYSRETCLFLPLAENRSQASGHNRGKVFDKVSRRYVLPSSLDQDSVEK